MMFSSACLRGVGDAGPVEAISPNKLRALREPHRVGDFRRRPRPGRHSADLNLAFGLPSGKVHAGRQDDRAYLLSGQTGRTSRPNVAAMMSLAAWYEARIAKARVTPPPAFVISGWRRRGRLHGAGARQAHGKRTVISEKAHGTLPKSRQGPLATIAVGRAPPPCVPPTLQRVLAESDTQIRHPVGAIWRGPSSQAEAAGSQAAEQHSVLVATILQAPLPGRHTRQNRRGTSSGGRACRRAVVGESRRVELT